MRNMFKTIAERLNAGEELVLVTVIASSGATPRGAGAMPVSWKRPSVLCW